MLYLPALADIETLIDELAFQDPVLGFILGWHDVMTGNTIPASELRKLIGS